jgi:5-methylcytosine-specific restriction endonuclease McrA
MGRRQKEWARDARRRLILELGGKCARCGSTVALQIDCIVPQGPKHHKFSPDRRMSFYSQQRAKGNVQLLCSECHSAKSPSDAFYHAVKSALFSCPGEPRGDNFRAPKETT